MFNVDGTANKAGQISEVIDIVYTQSKYYLQFPVWASRT